MGTKVKVKPQSSTVTLSPETLATLQRLSKEESVDFDVLIEKAIRVYRFEDPIAVDWVIQKLKGAVDRGPTAIMLVQLSVLYSYLASIAYRLPK